MLATGFDWRDVRDRVEDASTARLFLLAVVAVAALKVNAVVLVLFTDSFDPFISAVATLGVVLGVAGWVFDVWR